MNLNLYVIRDEMKEYRIQGQPDAPVEDLPLVTFYLVGRDCCFSGRDILYIADAASLPPRSAVDRDVSVLCSGRPEPDWLTEHGNVLYTEEAVALTDLSNAVAKLFYKYTCWEQALQRAAVDGQPPESLVECSTDILRNPTALYEGSQNMLLYSWSPRSEQEAERKKPGDRDYLRRYEKAVFPRLLPEEESLQQMTAPGFPRSLEAEPVSLTPENGHGFRELYCNIHIHGEPVGRVVCEEVFFPFRYADYGLLRYLCNFLEDYISHHIPEGHFDTEASKVMRRMLDKETVSAEYLRTVLQHTGWADKGSYLCIALIHIGRGIWDRDLRSIALRLAPALQSRWYCRRKDCLYFLCSLECFGSSEQTFYERTTPLLRDALLAVGFSVPFQNFEEFPIYCGQARRVLDCGMRAAPERWSFKAEDYRTACMLDKLVENESPDLYIPEGLKRLAGHDREKGSSYTRLLEVYLEEERYITGTIQKCYLNRNTFLYQLKRIEQILAMDLNDPDVRLSLRIALKIMDRQPG